MCSQSNHASKPTNGSVAKLSSAAVPIMPASIRQRRVSNGTSAKAISQVGL